MYRPRIIPTLLLKGDGLVKSVKFKDFKYIGDPINAVKIFNDLHADELVFLDIEATKEGRCISLDFVKEVGDEANMPFAVGGGINDIKQIQQLISAGAEKVIITTEAVKNPEFISKAAETFGSSTIVVGIDVKKKWLGNQKVWSNAGTKESKYTPVEFAQLMESKGAGELIVQNIERDGSMTGYDIELIKSISESVSIPVVALGGAGKISDLEQAFKVGFANGLACGSLFVYQGSKKGVLINYPEKGEINFN